jgi:hypothetical protein
MDKGSSPQALELAISLSMATIPFARRRTERAASVSSQSAAAPANRF